MQRLCGAVIVACLLASAGCSRRLVSYVDSDVSISRSAALQRAEIVDAKALANENVIDATELRHDALTNLRAYGDRAASAAALITQTFPADTASVPFYVEEVRYHGKPALLVIEAIGRPGGKLTDERVWVIDGSGDVLLSGVR